MNLEEQKRIALEKVKEIEAKLEEKKNLKLTGKTKFYNFSQNNSGGSFREDENLDTEVIIEAHSAEEANLLADNFGIYFDGCSQGIDCSCCGDRWYPCSEEGTEKPEMYGKSVYELYDGMFRESCIIHYLDGRKEKVVFKKKADCKHEWGEWKKSYFGQRRECLICEEVEYDK